MVTNAKSRSCADPRSRLSGAALACTLRALRVSKVDCLRSAVASAIFEIVWTTYHGSGFATGKLLREWCIGFTVGLLITLGERAVVMAAARRSVGGEMDVHAASRLE